jgi:citrate lyase gamma subunit
MAEVPKQQGQAIPILPEDKALYFNGFAMALGVGDVVITLTRNGVPIVTLNASYTVTKTFGQSITATINKLEELTEQEIMTVEKITASTAKLTAPDGTQ